MEMQLYLDDTMTPDVDRFPRVESAHRRFVMMLERLTQKSKG